ncbi:MAG TPA: hypothetical protein VIK89_11955 [Cytophagaceae bacterium]
MLLAVAFTFISFHIYNNTYWELLNWVKERYPDIYHIDELGSTYFSLSQYKFLRVYVLVITALCYTLVLLSFYYRNILYGIVLWVIIETRDLFVSIVNSYRFLERKQLCLVAGAFILILIHHTYFLTLMPFRVDDVFSYLFFVRNGPLVSALHYPEPNNHILFNILCSLLKVFSLSPLWTMKIPSLFYCLIALFILFPFVKYFYGFATAFICLVLSGFMHPSFIYAIQGRGYMLMSLFVLCAMCSIFLYLFHKKKGYYLFLFGLFGVLGAYTMPTFLLFYIPVIVYALIYLSTNERKKLLLAVVVSGVITLMLYVPVIIINGHDTVFNNRWVRSLEWWKFIDTLPSAIVDSINYLLALPSKGHYLVPLLLISLLWIFKKGGSEKKWIQFFVLLLVFTGLFLFVTRRFPPYRVWTYLSFLTNITLAILIVYYVRMFVKSFSIYSILITSLLVFAYTRVVLSTDRFLPDKKYYKSLDVSVKHILNSTQGDIYVDKDEFLYFYLLLENTKRDKIVSIDRVMQKEKQYDVLVLYNDIFPLTIGENKYIRLFSFDGASVFQYRKIDALQ